MIDIALPPELLSSIGSESKDFAVEADRAKPLKVSLSAILYGAVWTGMGAMLLFIFVNQTYLMPGSNLKSAEGLVFTGLGKFGLYLELAIIMIIALSGVAKLFFEIYSMFQKGGYFVGTPTRLVHFQNGRMRSIDWDQFSGDIEVSGNTQKGNISFKMRTGQKLKRRDSPDIYIPDTIYMLGIPNVFEVEQICRKRIKENDPTPTTAEYKAI